MSRSLSVILLIVAISIAFIFYLSNQKPEINYERFNLVTPGVLRTPDERFNDVIDYIEFLKKNFHVFGFDNDINKIKILAKFKNGANIFEI